MTCAEVIVKQKSSSPAFRTLRKAVEVVSSAALAEEDHDSKPSDAVEN
jgi:hypothetical protein